MRWLFLAGAAGVIPPQPPSPPLIGTPAYSTARWWLENDGQPVGAPDADVDALAAWEITTGDRDVIVAIVDTGVDVTHPQLSAAIRVNATEIPGNGIDEDGNGVTDDVTGYDFADDDADVLDPFAITHGSLVAGLVAGETTGLAPGVSILPVKVFSDSASDPDFESVAVQGIQYAIDEGARVIQIAWELDGAPGPAMDAVFAAAEAAGAVVVVAAGNYGQNLDATPAWPASYPTVLTVAGTDRRDRAIDLGGLFTTAFGPTTVEIAAPTEKLTSTLPGGFEYLFTGTSAAAPLVSAAAALVLSVDPALTPAQVRAILTGTADPLPSLAGLVSGGRLNAGNAVRVAAGAAAAPPRAVLGPVHRAEAFTATVFDARASAGAEAVRWWLAETGRTREGTALYTEQRFRTGGLWPVSLEVIGDTGLTHTAHAEVEVPFRGVPYPRSDASAHPYPAGQQLVTVTVPGAVALRLHFDRIDLAPGDEIVLYDRERGGLCAISGTHLDHSELVRGDGAYVYLRAPTGGGWGFSLDRVDAAFKDDTNRPPSIRVTGASAVIPWSPVALDAEASDPNGDPVSLSWRLLQRPEGSLAALSSTSGAAVLLTPDIRGDYALSATASDGIGSTSTLAWVTTRGADDKGGLSCSVARQGRAPNTLLVLLLLPLALARRRHRLDG